MEEKFIKKLGHLLEKAGLGEEEINKIMEITTGEEIEEPKEEGEPTVEPKGEDLPQEEEPKGEESVEEQPVEEEVVEEQPMEAPIEDAPVVEQPQVPIDELLNKIDELGKANEGLLARLDSLEEALKQAKVLTAEEGAIGIDQNHAPANDPVDNPMDDVLAQINHRR